MSGAAPWQLREFELEGFEQAELRRLSGRLLTPERIAKGDIRYRNGNLFVPSLTDKLPLSQVQLEAALKTAATASEAAAALQGVKFLSISSSAVRSIQ